MFIFISRTGPAIKPKRFKFDFTSKIMEEIYSVLIGVGAVIFGFFIGKLLAKFTQDEIKKGKLWFLIMALVFGVGAVISLILRNDAFFFSFLFFLAVIGGSLKR